jgi:glyoxylase-like metal-dependent hydrolase (beta-lactamase superfamily II)
MIWQIGDVRITKVPEQEFVTGGRHSILPGCTPEAMAPFNWLAPFLDERSRLRMSMHALVVETPSRRIIVDTCVGNDKTGRHFDGFNGMNLPFLDTLAAAGYAPEAIDTVLCTHMHVDHVGWNTRLVDGRWVPTFPNARYLFSARETAHWRDQMDDASQRAVFADSVQPVFDAGLADLVDDDHRVCPEVRLVPTPGHSPGHVSVAIESRGERALITGDFVHHPAQLALPHCGSTFDFDEAMARATRASMFESLSDAPVLVIGTHFVAPTAGRIVRDGAVWRLAT